MRDDIQTAIDALFSANPDVQASAEFRRALVRELLIITSTSDVEQREQSFIDKMVSGVRRAVEKEGVDPRMLLERLLNDSAIPYWRQKVIQWMNAYTYGAGFRH